jgi:hypothetical protein
MTHKTCDIGDAIVANLTQIPRRNRAKSSERRYCGQEDRYERPDFAIVPLPLGTTTAAH